MKTQIDLDELHLWKSFYVCPETTDFKKIHVSGLRLEVVGKAVNIGAEAHPYMLNQARMIEAVPPKSWDMTMEAQQSKVTGRMGKGRADVLHLPVGWFGRKVGSLWVNRLKAGEFGHGKIKDSQFSFSGKAC